MQYLSTGVSSSEEWVPSIFLSVVRIEAAGAAATDVHLYFVRGGVVPVLIMSVSLVNTTVSMSLPNRSS